MPNKLTRYGIRLQPVDGVWGHVMIKVLDGEFVKYEDYAALEKERDAECENWQKQCAAMQQKLAELIPDEKSTDVDYAYYPLTKARHEGWNACRAAILRNIEEAK